MSSQAKQPRKNGKGPHKGPQKGRGKSSARRAAAAMLGAIMRGKTLDEGRDKLTDLSDSERNLADAMVQATLRHYGEIENILAANVKKMPPRNSLAQPLLFIGAAQLIYMNVPAHAALHETVAATGRREQPYRGLINAVLRNITRAQESGDMPPPDALLNLPDWVRDNWQEFYGAEKTAAIAATLAAAPPLDLCFKNPAAAASWLSEYGAPFGGEAVSPTHIRLSGGMAGKFSVTDLPRFAEGDFWVQNAAAGRVASALIHALDGPSDVLDLCAAPGGKTMQLAAAGHKVTALDMSKTRLKRLADNLARTHLAAQSVEADALDWTPPAAFDAVLLDAPCTATGTLRRHPDLLRHRSAAAMEKLMALQAALLARAADWVTPNGILAFSVCSLQPQEGEQQIEQFLKTHNDFTLSAAAPPQRFTPDENMDGFYLALMHKHG
jgi:16S rRNA (cytosine967-C5)-methyltransferase